jgi:hypothetical protein
MERGTERPRGIAPGADAYVRAGAQREAGGGGGLQAQRRAGKALDVSILKLFVALALASPRFPRALTVCL